MMRDDENPPDLEPPQKATLPPVMKLGKHMWEDSVWFGLAVLALLAAKWGVLTGADFKEILVGILMALAMRSTGKGISLESLPFMKR